MKRILLSLFILCSMVASTNASHFMGGEIWWECLSNGKYVFHARLYQECYGINYQNTEIMNTTVPGLSQFNMNIVSITDITPVCNSNPIYPHIFCNQVTGSNQGGIKEWAYVSAPMTLPSVAPPSGGWVFSINICNRNNSTNIVNLNQYCGYLRAVMYPNIGMPAYPCFDNSPVFAESSSFVSSAGLPQSINHYTFDKDGDSLSFSWAEPWTDLNTPITAYSTGYSYSSPLPNPTQNPQNIPATIDPATGQISFTSYTQGAFVTCFKTSSFKNGVHVADVFREEQIILTSGGNSGQPYFTPPFPNNPVNQWVDTVTAGDNVSFPVYDVDSNFLNDSVSYQNVTLNAYGQFFGSGYTNDSAGCPIIPCATLNIPLPNTHMIDNSATFNWDVSPNHLLFGEIAMADSKEFIFTFSATDEYCPVPAKTTKTVKIVVKAPILPPPVMTNYNINPADSSLTIYWNPIANDHSFFKDYLLFGKTSFTSNYSLIDSISDINQNAYLIPAPFHLGDYFWYYLETRALNRTSGPSNILTNFNVGDVQNIDNKEEISVFYDPESQQLRINSQLRNPSLLNLQLFDCLGIIHFLKNVQLQAGKTRLGIPLTVPSPGVYFYSLNGGAKKYTGKVLIIR